MKPKEENAPSLRSGFKPNSEALYIPQNSSYTDLSPEEQSLHWTVERYNIVNDFLNTLKPESRDYAQHLILNMLPTTSVDNLGDLDLLMDFVSKGLKPTQETEDFDLSSLSKFKVIDDFITGIENT